MRLLFVYIFLLGCLPGFSQKVSDSFYLLKPDRVFDGEEMHTDWQVLVKNNLIVEVGKLSNVLKQAKVIDLKGCTLLPGFIEGHSHLFLHPYNEKAWNDQVLFESRAERVVRATNHARATLMAGFTTVRDLGTEGAQYDDVGLKKSIDMGLIPGPRMLVATRAIVARGSYGPKTEVTEIDFPRGAAEVGGMEELTNEIRTQIGKGADIIKIYADYRWGIDNSAAPTFSEEELRAAVKIGASAGRPVVVHASTAEGMRRAVNAGVSTIEHGDNGTAEIFGLMKQKNVSLCATLAAATANEQYKGWKKEQEPEPVRIVEKRKSFLSAIAAGVRICFGGDVGVFTHGQNVVEMELMVEYGMKPLDVLRSATSINADVFGLKAKVGRVQPGLFADLVAVQGNPLENISHCRKVKFVMKDGILYR